MAARNSAAGRTSINEARAIPAQRYRTLLAPSVAADDDRGAIGRRLARRYDNRGALAIVLERVGCQRV